MSICLELNNLQLRHKFIDPIVLIVFVTIVFLLKMHTHTHVFINALILKMDVITNVHSFVYITAIHNFVFNYYFLFPFATLLIIQTNRSFPSEYQ